MNPHSLQKMSDLMKFTGKKIGGTIREANPKDFGNLPRSGLLELIRRLVCLNSFTFRQLTSIMRLKPPL